MRPFGRHGVSMADTDDDEIPAAKRPFWENEAFWRGAAFVAPILVGVALLGGLVPLLFGPEAGFPLRTEIYARLALIGVAIVTFTTVMWRGMIATRQADQQREQIDALTRNNLADMLQMGAEKLSDANKPTNVTAGIATLETVATSGNRSYATQAMELLTDHIEADSDEGHHNTIAGRAVDALNRAHRRTGLELNRTVKIESASSYLTGSKSTFYKSPRWKEINCVAARRYVGGALGPSNAEVLRQQSAYFLATTILWHDDMRIPASSDCTGCLFVNCQFDTIQGRTLADNIFINCNFTGTVIHGSGTHRSFMEEELAGFANHYTVDSPPVHDSLDRVDDQSARYSYSRVAVGDHPFFAAWNEGDVFNADATIETDVFQRIDAIVEQKRQREPNWPVRSFD